MTTPKEPKASTTIQRRQSQVVEAQRPRKDSMGFQTELVEQISDLHSETRQKTAKALERLFIDQTRQAKEEGTFKPIYNETNEAFGLKLGLAVEYALYLNYWGHSGTPSPKYGETLRMMLHNVKNNPSLRDRLLNGTLTPNDFSKMSSFEMASKELQEQTAKIIKETEKQHILITDDNPRIRRTHKGDELIEDSQGIVNDESVFNLPKRRESEMEERHSPVPATQFGTSVELPDNIGESPTSARPLTVDTKAQARAPERKSSGNFNISNVWSAVDSPVQYNRPTNTRAHQSETGVKADPDIDRMLKDEDDEEPYSPVDYEMEAGVVWRGSIVMPMVAEFRGSAKYVAGTDLSSVYPWTQLITPVVSIEGRIPIDRASDYLCNLQYSKTVDVTVVSVSPSEHSADQEQFNKLYDYFSTRDRWGVIGKGLVSQVRDTYIIPLEKGTAKKPEFLELLVESTIEEDRPVRTLLIVYVIKTVTPSSAQATPRQPDFNTMGSPINATPLVSQYRAHSISQGPQMSPLAPQGLEPYGASPATQHGFATPQAPPPQRPQDLQGLDAARHVLGEYVTTPVVRHLLETSPNTGVVEFGVVREIFEQLPASRTDVGVLMGALTARLNAAGMST